MAIISDHFPLGSSYLPRAHLPTIRLGPSIINRTLLYARQIFAPDACLATMAQAMGTRRALLARSAPLLCSGSGVLSFVLMSACQTLPSSDLVVPGALAIGASTGRADGRLSGSNPLLLSSTYSALT